MSGASDSPVRLSPDVRPTRYEAHLTVDPAQTSFVGKVRIELQLLKPAREVRLHSRTLEIQSVRIGLGEDLAGTSSTTEDGDVMVVPLPRTMGPGPATIEIGYTGTVASGMAGLYMSKDGDEACLATQCEATDARTFIPCFDEPAFKAPIAWTVTAPKGQEVLTNGKLGARRDHGPNTIWTFEATAAIPSYLFALVVGKMQAGGERVERKTPFKVYSTGGKQDLGDTGRDLAARMLGWYEDYFAQPYAFGKYDQVAVPSFAFGAMENAGLVVFRPSLILVDPRTASWEERKDVALVVAHEFAHMWFGNLVTMAWWDDLWLNEAFAEWMAHRIAHELEPELDVWARFRARASGALATDTLSSTHAIYHPVKTPAEASEMFDAITYGKGSAVMRMLEAFLGPDAFRSGLRSYMAEFRFGNARGDDLWRHLGKASNLDVAALMKDWVTQPGHPVVRCSWDGATLTVRQERARSSPLAAVHDTMWRVPLVLRWCDDAGIHTMRHLLEGRDARIPLKVTGRLKWLWPNGGDVGFYQCSLDDTLLRMAVACARDMAPEERVAMQRDLWHDVRMGSRRIESFLAAFEELADGDANYVVVQSVVGAVRELERILETDASPHLATFRAWVERRLGPAYAKVGATAKPADTPPERLRRAYLLRAVAGVARQPAALADARRIALDERHDPAKVDADLAGIAVAVDAVTGDARTLDTHLATYRARRDAHASPQLVERYLYTLAAFRDQALVARVLSLLDTPDVAAQAVGPILRGMLTEPHAQRAAWRHMTSNWPQIRERVGEAWVANLIEASGEMPPDTAAQVRAFWEKNRGTSGAQAWLRAQERLEQRAELLARIRPGLSAWAAALNAEAKVAAPAG